MLSSAILSFALGAAGALAQNSAASAAAAEASLVAELVTANGQGDRVNLLSQDSEFVFDFLNPPSGAITSGAGGHLVLASVADFPALVSNGVAMAVGFLGACGLNTPHLHPRATEFLYSVNNTITTGMIEQSGTRFIFNNVTQGQGIVLPQGSIHFQFNDNCEPATFVSALSSEDPGASLVAQIFFGLTPGVVSASLGEIGVQEVAELAALIPDDFAQVGSCLQRCGLQPGTVTTAQQVPRVAGNSFPSGISTAPTPSHSVHSRSLVDTLETGANLLDAVANPVSGAVASGSTTQPVTIALIVIVSIMGVGYLALGAMFFMNRFRGDGPKGRSFTRPTMRDLHLVHQDDIPELEKYDPPAASA